MRNTKLIILSFFVFLGPVIFPQGQYRSGRFFHHSTGNRIWGPNGSSTSIPNEIILYNSQKGYIGNEAVSMNESWFPDDDNEWYTWHRIFDNSDPNNNIYPYFQNNKIIVIKSCYPSSEIVGVGSPADTINNPALKTIYNYKWHWRSIVRIMEQYPDNFFVIWTNAPLVPSATNIQEASLADQFCTWAKDTLAAGNDPLFGAFPSNVYVFDFFHKLADANGMLQLQYATSTTDSHPNDAATDLVAPQFVQEIFDAAIFYEGIIPVELTSFTLSAFGREVMLEWSTATELNNYGFDIERSVISNEERNLLWDKIGFVNGQGTTTLKNEYSFTDKNIDEGKYHYRLKQIDLDGTYTFSNELEIDINLPDEFLLEQNYPNPFNPGTIISWQSPVSSNQTLKIYDLLGNEVATLVDEFRNSGSYQVQFNVAQDSRPAISSGVYYYQLKAGEYVETKKMILLR